jgi:hypothetical protein
MSGFYLFPTLQSKAKKEAKRARLTAFPLGKAFYALEI